MLNLILGGLISSDPMSVFCLLLPLSSSRCMCVAVLLFFVSFENGNPSAGAFLTLLSSLRGATFFDFRRRTDDGDNVPEESIFLLPYHVHVTSAAAFLCVYIITSMTLHAIGASFTQIK